MANRAEIIVTEELARKMNTVAHKWEHADIVRNDVVTMAKSLELSEHDTYLLETAALMHDIGLDYCENRGLHSLKSADIFLETFKDSSFSDEDKEKIIFLISYHDKYIEATKLRIDENFLKMLRILIDADTLELLGERGYERALETAQSRGWPDFDKDNPKGKTFGFSSQDFDKRFELKRKGKVDFAIEPTLVGQLNFQISCADLLFTDWAKDKAVGGVEFLRNKINALLSNG